MAELIDIITRKPKWEEKINNAEIVAKWKKELGEQNVNSTVLDLVIALLKNYKNVKSNEYEDDDEYAWVLDLGLKPEEFSIAAECKCKCNVCTENEYKDNSDYCPSSGEDSANEKNYIKCT